MNAADLAELVAGTPLAARLRECADPLLDRRADELAQLVVPDAVARGLARVVSSSTEVARYLSLRPAVLERLAEPTATDLASARQRLPERAPGEWESDLEAFVDGLRICRRDETAYAACLDLGAAAPFGAVSVYLSELAEVLVQRALAAARAVIPGAAELDFAILGMGKVAGRELTYHSDLDLIFLYGGDTEQVHLASRLAQKLIHYLATATRWGTGYAIDARLRPSGGQGALVISYDAYASYQLERAAPWEHLALMRCRALAGNVAAATATLEKVQAAVRAREEPPWGAVAELRSRIAAERTREAPGQVAVKTGVGGLMDVDFLAAGALLEHSGTVELPAVPDMLRAAVPGARVEALIEAYGFLRVVEARMRWVAGRPVEVLDSDPELFAVVAELVEPGLDAAGLRQRAAQARGEIAALCESVLAANSINSLAA